MEESHTNNQRFNQNGCDKKFNRVVLRTHMEKENQALTEIKRRQQKLSEEENRKCEEMMQSRHREALRRDQEKINQRMLKARAVAQYQADQMKERELLKEKERLQDKKDREMLHNLDEQHAQELRREAEKKALSKKINLKNQLEDINTINLTREEQVHRLNMEEQKAKRVQLQKDALLLKQKAEQTEKFRKLQTPKQIVWDQLAATKREQAATGALREKQRLAKEKVKIEAELAKQQREKAKNNAAMVQSISAHRQKKTYENEQKAKAEQQGNVDWLQAQKEADRLFLTNEKLKAQKTREDRMKIRDFNLAQAAEKRARLEQQRKEDHDTAVRNAEQAEKEMYLRQYVQHELHEAAENLLCQERRRLTIKYNETSNIDVKPDCLPSISKAAKTTVAAKDSTRGGSGLRVGTGEPRMTNLSRRSSAPSICNLNQAFVLPFKPCLPPIRKAVKQRS
ncbi:trichohyalin-like protein [Lates japonicus]|uniref:Trichohyalin-like protein n=1 Tax=Lates japonicus TaxID=270547 RepID=A0AAD3QZG9_LATJO|nr:trichohyalin-like protein [Lates japonicus]